MVALLEHKRRSMLPRPPMKNGTVNGHNTISVVHYASKITYFIYDNEFDEEDKRLMELTCIAVVAMYVSDKNV